MKNIYLILILIFCTKTLTLAQGATKNNDTVTYRNLSIYPSQEIHLGYGCRPDKQFVFVYAGVIGRTMPSNFSKEIVLINEIKRQNGKWYAIGRFKNVKGLVGNTILIDIECAIDNNEIVL